MENYVRIASFQSEMEARVAQATLAAGGIESFLENENAGGMLPVLDSSEGVWISVDPEKEAEARDLLNKPATDMSE